jgi:hypothetical protein
MQPHDLRNKNNRKQRACNQWTADPIVYVPEDVERRAPWLPAPDDVIQPLPSKPKRRTDLKPMEGW